MIMVSLIVWLPHCLLNFFDCREIHLMLELLKECILKLEVHKVDHHKEYLVSLFSRCCSVLYLEYVVCVRLASFYVCLTICFEQIETIVLHSYHETKSLTFMKP